MRTVVLVKQVPEVSELELDPVTKRLKREGVPCLINPFDRRAVLEAIRLRGELGGTVVAVTMGPPQAESALRECLGLGVDEAVHLCDRGFAGADTLATARALARAIERLGFDLIVAGRYSIDSETGQVGPEVAALLDVPLLSGVRRLAIEPGEGGALLSVECENDDGANRIEARLPALLTCTDRWKTRTPMVMPDDEAAQTKPVLRWSIADLGGLASDYGEAGSPTWVEDVRAVESQRAKQVISNPEPDAGIHAALERIEAMRAAARRAPRGRAPAHRRQTSPARAVWVVGERGPDGALRPVTRELLCAADRLAGELDCGVAVFLLAPRRPEGDASELLPDDSLAIELGQLGADLLLVPDVSPSHVDARLASLEAAIRAHEPQIVLAPATALGRDLVPLVAARLGLGLVGDAIDVVLDANRSLHQLKPAFGGQVVAPILSRTRPAMATLRPGIIAPSLHDPDRAPVDILRLDGALHAASARVRCVGFLPEVSAEGAALEEARVIVCVGYGLGKEQVARAGELAQRLGGAIAGTRKVCDLGWLPRQVQVGLSGRNVAPELYLAFGVRGSFNHMVGLRAAGTVIAINRDAKAEIFRDADLGVVADAASFLEGLLSRLEA